MTKLTKAVRRDVGGLGLTGGDAGEYIVTLWPNGILGLRRKRSRRGFAVSLGQVYRLAAAIEAEQIRLERRKEG